MPLGLDALAGRENQPVGPDRRRLKAQQEEDRNPQCASPPAPARSVHRLTTPASALEPPSEKKLYQDLGEAPDIVNYKPPQEFSRLNAWITNPNAPRASGTVSVPGLRISEADLAREGRRILADPEAVESEMLISAAQIDEAYDRCLAANAQQGDQSQCVDAYVREADSLRRKASEVYAAVNAARTAEAREQEIRNEDAAETQRVENERAAMEHEAQRAKAEAEATENPPDLPQR